MVRIPDFAPAFGRPPNSYDGMRTIMLVHQPFFLFLLPPLFPVHAFFFNDRGWKLKLLAPQRSTRLLTKKKKKINVNVARRRRRRRFIIRWMRRWDETEERILVEAWMKGRKKERKSPRFENMNVCIFVTRREYLIKRKKKEPLVSRNLSHKLKSYLKLKLSQVILRRYISVLNIASIYDLPFVYISINV